MKDGQEVKFVAEGEPHIDGDPGDLILKVKTQPHRVFERRGDDLYTNVTVSLADALTGFSFVIEHLDGRKLSIQVGIMLYCQILLDVINLCLQYKHCL